MQHKKLITATALLVIGGFCAGNVWAENEKPRQQRSSATQPAKYKQGDDRGPKHQKKSREAFHKRMKAQLFKGIELTDAQQEKVEDIMKTAHDERRAWHEAHRDELEAHRAEFKNAMKSKDKEAIAAAKEKMKKLRESAPKPDATLDKVNSILTPDQQTIFAENRAKIKENWEQGKKRGPGANDDGERGPRHKRDGDKPDGKERMRDRGHKALFKDIELSQDQRESIHEIFEQGRKEKEEWRESNSEALKAARAEMIEARKSKDKEAMDAAREKMRTLLQSAPKMESVFEDIKAELTPEQQKQFEANQKNFRKNLQGPKGQRDQERGDKKRDGEDGKNKKQNKPKKQSRDNDNQLDL
ncbi:Spy/CpxP family protein refolding chaperone [Poriferisphaera sp. WC338]|uniref:Spy/CpxP family protein refolding chaperone n=1 Tax=Poriferisphaera sp. WC338 TaxID=3425129 RepID=UPI003D81AECA